MSTNKILDTYQDGWNITRNVLLNKQIRTISTIFGNRYTNDCDLLRDIEAERLHRKYSMMLLRREKEEYCSGAIDLINEWDRIKRVPKKLNWFGD